MKTVESDKLFRLFSNIKKRPYLYINSKTMTALAAMELGFQLGYNECSKEIGKKNSYSESDWMDFLSYLREKYYYDCPWFECLIKECESEEKAYELFFEEMENFLKENNIEVPE